MATGEIRATMALTEPGGGSDLQAMRTTARRATDDGYVVNGSKTWITNARRSQLVAVLCKTDPAATPAHRACQHPAGRARPRLRRQSRDLPKLGYKGVESCELAFDDFRVPAGALLGGAEGQGFAQMMRGLEIGRIQVASPRVGVARAALEDSLRYAQQREAFGKPIWQHQSIGNYLADMATKLEAARQLVHYAARRYDSGERADLEAGMAKLFASETAMEIALNAVRIHGGYGYSTEFDVERYFRDAPLMIVGEGTNEIQRSRHRAAAGQPAPDLLTPRGELSMRHPLDGITVVALEQAVAAPFATRQLADLGARVIKIERPGVGDFARGYDRTVHGQSSLLRLAEPGQGVRRPRRQGPGRPGAARRGSSTRPTSSCRTSSPARPSGSASTPTALRGSAAGAGPLLDLRLRRGRAVRAEEGVRPADPVRDRAGHVHRHPGGRRPRRVSPSPTSPPACTPTAASSPPCTTGSGPGAAPAARLDA